MVTLQLWDDMQPAETLVDALAQSPFWGETQHHLARQALLLEQWQRMDHLALQAAADNAVNTFRKKNKLNDETAFHKALHRRGMTKTQFCSEILKKLTMEALINSIISPNQVSEEFVLIKAQWETLQFGLLELASQVEAQQLLEQLRNGQDFVTLAQRHSLHSSSAYGGLVGPLPLLQINPTLREALLKLQPGQYAEPVSLQSNRWVVLRLYRYQPVQLTPTLARQTRNQLFDQWMRNQVRLASPALVEEPGSALSLH